MDATFEHPPLDLSTKSIRVIQILPGKYAESVRCQMAVEILCGGHVALSYVWGTDKPTHKIEIDGRPFFVRQNLHDFLCYARRYLQGRNLWIDAICIDQENTNERNHQVRHMAQIYQLAESVISWLGEGHEKVDGLLREIPDVLATCFEDYMAKAEFDHCVRTEAGILELCNNQYWSRLWIVPEMYTARRLTIVVDKAQVSWSNLRAFLCQVFEYRVFIIRESKHVRESNLASFVQSCTEGDHVGTLTFFQLLTDFGSSVCSDPRDRLFALATLSIDAQSIPVDYNLDRFQLFCHVSSYLNPDRALRSRLLDCLSIVSCDDYVRLFQQILRRNEELFHDVFLMDQEPPKSVDWTKIDRPSNFTLDGCEHEKCINNAWRMLGETLYVPWHAEHDPRGALQIVATVMAYLSPFTIHFDMSEPEHEALKFGMIADLLSRYVIAGNRSRSTVTIRSKDISKVFEAFQLDNLPYNPSTSERQYNPNPYNPDAGSFLLGRIIDTGLHTNATRNQDQSSRYDAPSVASWQSTCTRLVQSRELLYRGREALELLKHERGMMRSSESQYMYSIQH